MFRGQAEVIATAIMVGLALVVALGIVYYLAPLVGGLSKKQSMSSVLADAAAGISCSLVASNTSDTSFSSVYVVHSLASQPYRVYVAVLPLGEGGVPIQPLGNYSIYLLNGSVAPLTGENNWTLAPSDVYTGFRVYLYMNGDYQRLSDFGIDNITVYDIGVLYPGNVTYIKANASLPLPGYPYYLTLFIRISNNFYEIVMVPACPNC